MRLTPLLLAAGAVLAALLFLPAPARALEPATVTIDSVSSTDTVRGIDITTQTATSVIVSTGPLYRQVCVQNLDTSAFLACSENVNVSTLTASNLIGVVIPPAPTAATPAQPTCMAVAAGSNYYCKSASVTAATRAVIIRGR